MSLLAEIANRLGYFDDAEFLLQKAVEFEPESGDLRLQYASILKKNRSLKRPWNRSIYSAVNFLITKLSSPKGERSNAEW